MTHEHEISIARAAALSGEEFHLKKINLFLSAMFSTGRAGEHTAYEPPPLLCY